MPTSTPGPSERRRPGPRRRRGLPAGPDEVRRAVLDTAAAQFAQRGVAQVTLRDIAAGAKVNLGLVGRYVGTREELIRAVFEDLTTQLVEEIRESPTSRRGFGRDSVMGRWTLVLTYLVINDPAAATDIGSAPIRELRSVIEDLYGLTPDAAGLRVAQLMGSAIGWRLFESYLVESAELGDLDLEDVREELARSHRRLAATKYPSPPDPKSRPQRH